MTSNPRSYGTTPQAEISNRKSFIEKKMLLDFQYSVKLSFCLFDGGSQRRLHKV